MARKNIPAPALEKADAAELTDHLGAPRFARILAATLDYEGRVVAHDRKDKGGVTAYGISKAAHPDAFEDGPPSLDEAVAIYLEDYWLDAGVSELPEAVAAALFDYRVHSGDTAIRELQRLVGATADGVVGPETLERVKRFGERLVGEALIDRREQNLRRVLDFQPEFNRWMRGWMNRLDRVRTFLRVLWRAPLEADREVPRAGTRGRRDKGDRPRDRQPAPEGGASGGGDGAGSGNG